MDEVFRYRGRSLNTCDVADIRTLIAAHPGASRRALSRKLCERWDWRQPNGQLRDMVCRSLMLALHRSGHIELPPVRWRPPNNVIARPAPAPVAMDRDPIRGRLGDIGPLVIRLVRGTAQEPLFNALIEAHHYLGYTAPVGEHLKYVVFAQDRPIACFASRRPATWVRGIGSSAGRQRHVDRISGFWSTTPGFSSCPGSRFRTWLPTCSGTWPDTCPGTGNGRMATRCIILKPSLTRAVLAAPVTGRRIGYF